MQWLIEKLEKYFVLNDIHGAHLKCFIVSWCLLCWILFAWVLLLRRQIVVVEWLLELVVARLEVASPSTELLVSFQADALATVHDSNWRPRAGLLAASSTPRVASTADDFCVVHKGQCCVTMMASMARRRARSVAFAAEWSSRSSVSDDPSNH